MKYLIVLIMLLIHVALLILLRLYAHTKVYFGNINLIWAAAIPIFGPLAGFVIVLGSSKEREYNELYKITNGETNDNYDFRRMEGDYLSAEEVLKINDTAERRKVMLEILRLDPSKYTEILKIASINEDVDTAHYATTSMVELQAEFQRGITKFSSIAARSDATFSDHRNYIEILIQFFDSKIMDEKLLRRQRMFLKGEIETVVEKYDCFDYDIPYIDNLIALEEYGPAIDYCEQLLREKNPREETFLRRITLYVLQNDYDGLKKFTDEIKEGKVTMSPRLMEEMTFWGNPDNVVEVETF